jgi:hypothetical protein
VYRKQATDGRTSHPLKDFEPDAERLVQLLVGARKPSEAEIVTAAEALRAAFRRGWLLRGELRSGRT